jgi:hypothetical protein
MIAVTVLASQQGQKRHLFDDSVKKRMISGLTGNIAVMSVGGRRGKNG